MTMFVRDSYPYQKRRRNLECETSPVFFRLLEAMHGLGVLKGA
jgi:hypothetical protein